MVRCRHAKLLSGYRSWAIAHAGLTFGEGLQLLAKLEVELLQCRALADGCKIKCRSVVQSLQATRFAKAKLTFWEGLELLAVIEEEFLERRALSDAWQGNTGQYEALGMQMLEG